MRHVYLTVQDCFVLDELLRGDEEEVRKPFRVLLRETAVSELLELGAATGTWLYYGDRGSRGSRLPFIPGLGALRLKPKVQVEHRAIGHDYGHTCFPPQAVNASPTGVRLAPRTEELLSHWRLSDTYASSRNRELTTRIAIEGTTDYYVSEDESAWHLAFSVEPRKRIAVTPISNEAQALVAGVEITPGAYIHVYPYGGVSVTLTFSLVFSHDRDVSAVIPLISGLIGRRGQPQFRLDMRGAEAGTVPEFLKGLGDCVAEAIVGRVKEYRRVQPDFAVSLGADPEHFSDAEIAGLLTLDSDYAEIRDGWVAARASLYGKYSGDRVTASRGSLAVVTSPRQFTPSGRRRFFWRCHAIKEFATLQALVLQRITWELRDVATASGPSEERLRRLIGTGEHLCEFHRGLPAHHRKWFYECQALAEGVETRERFYGALANLHAEWQRAAMMRKVEETNVVRFDISDSQIGTLNLGTIVGDVESKLTVLEHPEAADVRRGLTELTEAVLKEKDLKSEVQQELIESISVLAEEAQKKPEQQRGAIVRSVMRTIAAVASTATGLAVVWSEVEPVLDTFFS